MTKALREDPAGTFPLLHFVLTFPASSLRVSYRQISKRKLPPTPQNGIIIISDVKPRNRFVGLHGWGV